MYRAGGRRVRDRKAVRGPLCLVLWAVALKFEMYLRGVLGGVGGGLWLRGVGCGV